MKKNLLILIVFIIGITCYSQNGVQEKMLIAKYGLPVIFFSSSYNPKEYIIDYHDSLSRSNWKIILPPENMITEIAQLFIQKKLYEKAYWLLRMNIENYPKNYKLYQQMGDYYKIIGDNDRSFVYYSKALTIKYKFSSFISDSLLKIDDAITTDYKKLSEQVSRKALPPEYLVASIAFRLLEKKENEKAYSLFKMNTENYPNSYNAIDDLGDYYDAIGDSTKAFVYWANALIHQYHLPSIFFDASFDPASYFQVYYKELAEKSGKKILPSDTMLNAIGLTFLAGKMSDKAGQLLKINVENYPERPWHYFALSQYYASIDDNDKATQLNKKGEELRKMNQLRQGNNREPIADTAFNAYVTTPACQSNCPIILFDEAHNNYHTIGGRYKAFSKLMESDGFKIIRGQSPFTNKALAQVNVLVIASAGYPSQKIIPFSEIQVVNSWVNEGGALLVITDHDNLAIDELLHSFRVETFEVNVTTDPTNGKPLENGATNPSNILFTEKDKLLGGHPIIQGRTDNERIRQVQTYAGRTIIGPPGSLALLLVSDSARDYMVIDPDQRIISRVPVKTQGLRTHGLAFGFGKGKVVVVGEAAMLTAQLWPPDFLSIDEGLNIKNADNRQFALNIMRWLTGYLK